MKVLFLTLVNIDSINERNLYADLMRKFRDEGHEVYIVTPSERRLKKPTELKKTDGITLLRIKTLNIQKTNLIEKGISTLLIEHQFLSEIKKYFDGIRFELVLYSTPPITFNKVIRYIKKRDMAFCYLLLKDIFPQNAVDLGMMNPGGIIHRYFRKKEHELYKISDAIGCMSPANKEYVIRHNPEINPGKVEVNPNSIEPINEFIHPEAKLEIRKQFGVPLEATVFICGGNLGKPQGIDFLIEVLEENKHREDVFFMIVGSGTEYNKILDWFTRVKPQNAKLITYLPKNEYDRLIQVCDVGLIFLDKRFTIPNFPSRLLSYLEYKMPVIAATDRNTDIGKIIEENHFGFWCESGDLLTMNEHINKFLNNQSLIEEMGAKGFDYMKANYTVLNSYDVVLSHLNKVT